MKRCEVCDVQLDVEARWCDPCAEQLSPQEPMRDLGEWTREDWQKLEADLETDFPAETAKAERDIRRIARRLTRGQA